MISQIFEGSPAIKIVEWMLDNQAFDHSLKEVADGTSQNITVVKRNFEPLVTFGVAKVNRTLGRDSMYVLDVQNRCTKAIIEFDKQIAKFCQEGGEPNV